MRRQGESLSAPDTHSRRATRLADIPYCLNVFPGEHWQEAFAVIRDRVPVIRERIGCHDCHFALGLRLSAQAVREMDLPTFRRYVDGEGLRVVTVNAFPFGRFHQTRVKEQVYAPDWSTIERTDYTLRVLDVLQELLPASTLGSVSTVPLGYTSGAVFNIEQAQRNLKRCCQAISKPVILALEPEPDCLLSRTEDVIRFFSTWSPPKQLGICFDLCHQFVEFEDILDSLDSLTRADIPVGKVHLSAAPAFAHDAPERLHFAHDSVYLHQARLKRTDGVILPVPDATEESLAHLPSGELRIHYHIPLSLKPIPQTIADRLLELRLPMEIETYTFNVLPNACRAQTLEEQIVSEYRSVAQSFHLT